MGSNIGYVELDVVKLEFFCWDNLGNLLFLIDFLTHGFVNLSDLIDGACCTLGGDVGDGIGVCTLVGCTTGSTLGYGATGWVMITGDGS